MVAMPVMSQLDNTDVPSHTGVPGGLRQVNRDCTPSSMECLFLCGWIVCKKLPCNRYFFIIWSAGNMYTEGLSVNLDGKMSFSETNTGFVGV